MGRSRKQKPIDSYSHGEAERVNNPPVGLVTAGTDPEGDSTTYRHEARGHDPHIDPELSWAQKRERGESGPRTSEQGGLGNAGGEGGCWAVRRGAWQRP